MTFVAYPECQIQWHPNLTEFSLTCPWITVSVDVEPSAREEILSSTQSGLNPTFMDHFREQPIGYFHPRTAADFPMAIPAPQDAGQDPWDLEELLTKSRISGLQNFYDPLTAYGLIQRFRLISENSATTNLGIYAALEKLRQKDELAFFEICALILKQSFYITSNCVPALTPALQQAALSSEKVRSFINAEDGHHLLILRSLKNLGVNENHLDEIPVLPETQKSIELLRFAAEKEPLAFCCMIGLFEGSVYAEEDPLAQILRRSRRPAAAAGIEAHFKINKKEQHSKIGEAFVVDMPPVDQKAMTAAIQLTETATRLGNSLTQELARRIEMKLVKVQC